MTGRYTGGVRCPRCRADYPEAAAHRVCPACRLEGVHVNPAPVYDLAGLDAPVMSTGSGMFRYRDLLPLRQRPISLGEGDTPLLPLPRAGRDTGLDLWWKDESRNPTWSYKDRLAAVAVSKAVEDGADTVVVSSTGNHGAAVAAYAARAGIRCVVLTLASVPPTMKTLIQSYGATVVALRRPADRWVVMAQGVEQRGWVPMSGYLDPPPGSNPFGVDGYKTIAYELVESLGRRPDVVVAPVAYGDGIAGVLRGFDDLLTMGVIDSLPRIVAAEPYGAFAAQLRIADPITPPPGGTVSFSIAAVTASWQGTDAIRRSGGTAVRVSDEDTMAAQRSLSATEGLYAEASSAITFAALAELVATGRIRPGEQVVLLGTSSGLKDPAATAALLPEVPLIEPSLEAFDRAVG